MCLVCVEWQAGRMTKAEVDRALTEIVASTNDLSDFIHAQEVLEEVDLSTVKSLNYNCIPNQIN